MNKTDSFKRIYFDRWSKIRFKPFDNRGTDGIIRVYGRVQRVQRELRAERAERAELPEFRAERAERGELRAERAELAERAERAELRAELRAERAERAELRAERAERARNQLMINQHGSSWYELYTLPILLVFDPVGRTNNREVTIDTFLSISILPISLCFRVFFFHNCHQFQFFPLLYTIHKFRTCLLYNVSNIYSSSTLVTGKE